MSWRQIRVLAAAIASLAIVFGIRQSFGLFMAPMTRDLGWSFAIFSFAIGLQNLVWGATQPFAGAIADKWGAGPALYGGFVIYAIGVAGMALAPDPGLFYLAAGLLVGTGAAGCGLAVIFAAVLREFPPQRQTLALGLSGAGISVGQLLFIPAAGNLIVALGWRESLLLYAGISCLLALTLIPLARGASARPAAMQGAHSGQSLKAAVTEAGGHTGFLLLTAGFFVCGFHVTIVALHLPAYVASCGLDPRVGAWAIAIIGITNMIGSTGAGFLGDRYRKKYLLSLIYFARAVLIAAYLAVPVTATSTYLFAVGFGFLWLSTVPLTNGVIGQIFGVQYIGTLSGIVFFSHQVGAFFGAWLGGWIYDVSGSYEGMWLIAVGLGVLSGLINLPIADKPMPRVVLQAR